MKDYEVFFGVGQRFEVYAVCAFDFSVFCLVWKTFLLDSRHVQNICLGYSFLQVLGFQLPGILS